MEHKYLAKRYWADKPTAMGKSDVLARSFNDVINLSLGDPDMITPELIIDKAFEHAKAGYTKYTDFRGMPKLRQEIAKFYKEEYGLDIPDNEIFISTSGCIAMFLALEAIVNDGDEVILQGPYFTPYPGQVRLARGIPVEFPTYEEEDFQINCKRLEEYITDKTRVLVINSPNNPAGSCLTLDTMKEIARIAEKYDLIVISDEIYTKFSFENKFIPFRSLPGMAERTITINSFSKNFVMTGWRIGFAAGPRRLIKKMTILQENYFSCANTLGQKAGAYALHTRCGLDEMKESYRRKRDLVCDVLDHFPKVSYSKPEGAFYIFMNISKCGCTSLEMADRLLKETGVITVPGSSFGSKGEGHLRLSYAGSDENLLEALHRMEPLLS